MPQIPVLIQILVIFALVVVASARKVHLGLAATLGGILFGLLQGLSPLLILTTLVGELLKADTLLLLLLVSGIMVFSGAMKQAGGMALFSRALLALVPSRRLALALAPVLIGTLPMPGGAILSAPLVDAFDPQRSRSATTLSATNYWFRHILELCWPLYPAFILTATLTGLPVNRLMLLNLYAPPLLFLLGWLFILPRQKNTGGPSPSSDPTAPIEAVATADLAEPARQQAIEHKGRLILEGFTPLVLIIGGYAVLDLLWRFVGPFFAVPAEINALISRYAWIFTGLIAACLYIGLRYGWKSYKKAFNLSTLKLTGVVAGIKVFAALLTAAGVAESSAAELASLGIPALIAVALLPLVTGLVTGVGFGYVGLSFPIILGLFPAGGTIPQEAIVVLGGAFGFAGMMLSPLHVCIVVTAAHFKTGLPGTVSRFALPMLVFLTIAVSYSLLLMRLL